MRTAHVCAHRGGASRATIIAARVSGVSRLPATRADFDSFVASGDETTAPERADQITDKATGLILAQAANGASEVLGAALSLCGHLRDNLASPKSILCRS